MLDTNVIVSAFLSPHGAPAHLFQHYQQDIFTLLVSEAILKEYQQALNYPKVQDVGAYKGIQVLSPSLFLTMLEKGA